MFEEKNGLSVWFRILKLRPFNCSYSLLKQVALVSLFFRLVLVFFGWFLSFLVGSSLFSSQNYDVLNWKNREIRKLMWIPVNVLIWRLGCSAASYEWWVKIPCQMTLSLFRQKMIISNLNLINKTSTSSKGVSVQMFDFTYHFHNYTE